MLMLVSQARERTTHILTKRPQNAAAKQHLVVRQARVEEADGAIGAIVNAIALGAVDLRVGAGDDLRPLDAQEFLRR